MLAKQRVSETQLREKASKGRKHRPFFKTLESPGPAGVNIIAEIKRASPSKGPIRPNLNPVTYARAYEQGGAAAISVLTDGSHFQGSHEDLKKAREAVTLPVLRKDFILSSYQIFESSVVGADAVLLIARILSRQQLKDYLALARELHLDALVEVHTETEIEKAGRRNRPSRPVGVLLEFGIVRWVGSERPCGPGQHPETRYAHSPAIEPGRATAARFCPPGAPRDASQRIGNARDLDGGNHTDCRFVPPSAR